MILSKKKLRGMFDPRFFHSYFQFFGEIWIVEDSNLCTMLKRLVEDPGASDACFSEKILQQPRSLLKLEGAFHLAVSDLKSKRGLLYRSLFCSEPIYFRVEQKHLIFSSSLSELLLVDQPLINQVDQDQLYSYLLRQKVDKNKTLFQGIERLPAGHILIYEKGKIQIFPLDLPKGDPVWQELDPGEHFSLAYDLLIKTILKRISPSHLLGVMFDEKMESVLLQHLFKQCHIPFRTFSKVDLESLQPTNRFLDSSSPLFFPFPIQNDKLPLFLLWLDEHRISRFATSVGAQAFLKMIQFSKQTFWERTAWLSFFRRRWYSNQTNLSEELLESLHVEMDKWILPEWEGNSPITCVVHPFVNRELFELSLSLPKVKRREKLNKPILERSLAIWFSSDSERLVHQEKKQKHFDQWKDISILNEWKLLDEIDSKDNPVHLFRTELWLQSLEALEKKRPMPEGF